MDDLKIISDTFSAEDKKEFGYFIQRQKVKKCRKDYELFQLLQQKKACKPQELIARLYPQTPNVMAYYALRKRLMRHLTDFIVLKRMTQDPTAGSTVMGWLSLARYLFEGRADRLAWNMLRKAEKLAAENEQFDLLNAVYNVSIEKADSEFADDLMTIIGKRDQNKGWAEKDEKANIANSIILNRLAAARTQGRDLQFHATIQEVLSAYELTEVVSQRPALFYRLMSIARSAVLARKDFQAFEPFIISQYQGMVQNHGFSRAHQHYHVSLLYMIAHGLYRNRKFRQSNEYLSKLYSALQGEARSCLDAFYARYIFLKAANDAFLGWADQSIALMEELITRQGSLLSQRDGLTARLGLSFLYFTRAAYGKANKLLLEIKQSHKSLEKIMGREWLLRKSLGEVIIQYEFGNLNLGLDKVKACRKNFASLLAQPGYKNVGAFLDLLEQFMQQPHAVTHKAFLQKVKESLDFVPQEREDLPSISFYAWLNAKMVNRPYYEVLQELAATK